MALNMHLPTGNTGKQKGGRSANLLYEKDFCSLFCSVSFWLGSVSAPDGHTGLQYAFVIHALPQVSAPFSALVWSSHCLTMPQPQQYGCIRALSSLSFLYASSPKHQLLWTAPCHPSPQQGLQCTSYEPECSIMVHVGFSLHRQGDCGLHLSSKKKISTICFLHISAVNS